MSVVQNSRGELIRITELGVEPLMVHGTPVKADHAYCGACGFEGDNAAAVEAHRYKECQPKVKAGDA